MDFEEEDMWMDFGIKDDNYDLSNRILVNDGSGTTAWNYNTLTANSSFSDEFPVFDIVNIWNQYEYCDNVAVGNSITTDGEILTIQPGTTVGNISLEECYSVYLTQKLRNVGIITFETRMRTNSTSINADSTFWVFGLGSDKVTGDASIADPIAFTGQKAYLNKAATISSNSGWAAPTSDFDLNQNEWHTYKIIVRDGAVPVAKFYLDGVLKKTRNCDVGYRNVEFRPMALANYWQTKVGTLEIAYIKVIEGN